MMNYRRRMLMNAGGRLPPQTTLEAASWADIATVAAAGLASTYWAIGDTKTITLGATVLGSTSITVEIIGFNHDDLTAGGKAPITFLMTSCFTTNVQINATDVNKNSWGGSAIRAFIRADVWSALPLELRNVIKDVNKLTSEGNASATISASVDNLFLVSNFEAFGSIGSSYAGEGAHYSGKFTSDASRVKGKIWWLRSPATNTTSFCRVTSTGATSYGNASNLHGIAVGFCI